MAERMLVSLAVSLALTEVLELAFALIFRVRGRDLALTALVNLITNPLAVTAYLLAKYYTAIPLRLVWPPVETAAVIAEWLLYRRCARDIKRPFFFSLGANAFSFSIGKIIGLLF